MEQQPPRMPSEKGPSSSEGEPIIQNVVFEEIKDRFGVVTGYKSSSRDRKKVELSANSVKPLPGISYEVRIVGDSKPEDPMSGVYLVELVPGQPSQVTTEDWMRVDETLNQVDARERTTRQSSAELYRLTGVPKSERSEETLPASRMVEKVLEGEKMLDEEIASLLSNENSGMVNDLTSLRRENLLGALREDQRIEKEKAKLLEEESEILKMIQEGGSYAAQEALQDVSVALDALTQEEEALLTSTPEAYYGLHLKRLKEYKQSLEEGRIVETPYVKERAEDIHAHMRAGKPVLIYGHLGTGKTELAMHVARKYVGKEALVISGSKNMSLAELYGHQVLQLDSVSPETLKEFTKEVEGVFAEWENENKEASEAEKNRMHNTVLQTYLTKLQKGTVTDFFLGPLYRAMAEGRPVIIDEVNAIPHEVLISLNHILTRKVGDEVLVQQDSGMTVTVQDGFGVLMTGNLNQGQDIYVDRQDMDPALLSRLYKVEYDYLPQSTDVLNAGVVHEDNELFEIILAKLIDRRGNLQLPEGTFGALQHLAVAARITQDVFAGREVDSSMFLRVPGASRGVQYFLKESVLSLRALDAILSQWQNEGYKHELDYYIWNEFIGQSTQPTDRAYLYQLFQNRFGFFADDWKQNPDIGSGGSIRSFDIKPPRKPAGQVVFHAPRQVIDMAYGPAPERVTWPGKKSPNEAEL